MKIFSFLLLCCLFMSQAFGQSYPQLRLRLGASKSIVSAARSDNDTYYRMYDKRSPLPSGIGLEFSKPLKKPNTSFIAGAFLDVQPYSLGINPNSFITPPGGAVYSSGNGSIRFYAGLEKRIGRREIPAHKNYFSIFGGLGISYNFPGYRPGDAWGGSIGKGVTNDGKSFQGIYLQNPAYPTFDGFYTQIRSHRAHFFTPDIFGGFRWNIRNKKGNTVLAVELVCNYGLMTKFYHDVSYTLDGQPYTDRLKDKGVNVQINVLVPLKNFGKKRKKIK
jgi:hypothetical protein